MTDALEGTVSVGGRTFINLRFADDIDGLAREEEELANLVERLDKASIAYGMNGQKLETITSFKYLGSVITDEGSKPENDWSISLSSKIRLMRSLVTSIFLYACKSWTLTAELQRRIQAMEMRCYRKIHTHLIQRSCC